MKFLKIVSFFFAGLLLGAMSAHCQSNLTMLHTFSALPNGNGTNCIAKLAVGPDGTFYGAFQGGSGNVSGEIFKVSSNGLSFTVLKYFTNTTDGLNPSAGLVLAGTTLYGTTSHGAANGNGAVFAISTNGSGFTNLYSFSAEQNGTNTDGACSMADLTLANGVLYGTTEFGGNNGTGAIFSINTNGTGFSNLYSFSPLVSNTNSDGANPMAAVIVSGATLYGTALWGGTNGDGTVFSMGTNGTGFETLVQCSFAVGENPLAPLSLYNNVLYGTAQDGGSKYGGTIFSLSTNGSNFAILDALSSGESTAFYPQAQLFVTNSTFYGTTPNGGTYEGGAFFSGAISGGGLSTGGLNGSTGIIPQSGLVASGFYLYGTTSTGASGNGAVYRQPIGYSPSPSGFYSFTNSVATSITNADGANPSGSLAFADGVAYGTTVSGGGSGDGSIFSMNTDGSGFSTLFNFPTNASHPSGNLIAANGAIYGTTSSTIFGINANGAGFTNLYRSSYLAPGLAFDGAALYGVLEFGGSQGVGSVFTIQTNGSGFSNLYSFSFSSISEPVAGPVFSAGMLYGTAEFSFWGGVYAVSTNGSNYQLLHSFTFNDGSYPAAQLTVGGSTLYGSTKQGGAYRFGTLFKVNTDGTGFLSMHNFSGLDGASPVTPLVLSGNILYGTTSAAGNGSGGNIFQINTDGTGFAVLYSFSYADGAAPTGGLTLYNGALFGSVYSGSAFNDGALFSYTLPIAAPMLVPIPLNILQIPNAVVLSWTNAAFSLQSAPLLPGPFTNIPGATSPYTSPTTGSAQFFQLKGNQ